MSRHIPISEIAAVVHRSSDLVKALAMLRAYFDDSGTHSNSLVTTISGYVGSEKTWKIIEGEWLAILADYRQYEVTWFHSADIASWQGEWAKVPLTICRDAPLRFARVLGKHRILPIWAAVVNEDFYRFATTDFLATFPDPFTLCFHQAMGQMYNWARHNAASKVAPIAAHGSYAEKLLTAHARYLRDGDFPEYIGPISFDEPRRVIPLQAADLLANQFYHYWIGLEYRPPQGQYPTYPVVLDEATKAIPPNWGACYSGDGMRLAVERQAERDKKRRGGPTGEG